MAKARLLVMDDEELVRTVAGKMLEFLGYEAVLARTGEEAVRLYRAQLEAGRPFDAVILDWMVPDGMDGYQTLAQLRSIDPEAKGILSSGFPEQEQDPSRAPSGFTAVIGKPYELKTLRETVEQVVGNPQARA